MLTIFYDGNCPLCNYEMQHLQQYDANNQIELIDIQQPGFAEQYPQIDRQKAMQELHALYNDEFLLGLDVTHRAWTLVGKGCWVAPLNWSLLKPMNNIAYKTFAKYRLPISQLAAKVFNLDVPNCDTGSCYVEPNNADHRR